MAKRPFCILKATVGSSRTIYDIGIYDDADTGVTIPMVATVTINKALYETLSEDEKNAINPVSFNTLIGQQDYGEVIDIGSIE